MVKKLFGKIAVFWALILTPFISWGQECTDAVPTFSITNHTGSSICEGEPLNFSAAVSPSNPQIPYEFQWQVQVDGGAWTNISGFGAETANLSNYAAAIGSNRIRLQVTYCGGTAGVNTLTSNSSATITVYENKTGSVNISADKTHICPGEQITFSSSPFNHGGSGATYEWRLLSNNSILSTASTFTSAAIPDGGQVKLYMTSSVPCVDPFESNIINISHKAGIPSQPSAISIDTEPDTFICSETSVTFSVTSDPAASNYIWTLPTGWEGASTTNIITLTTGQAGAMMQTISVKAENECGQSATTTLDVTVGPGIPATPSEIQITDEDNDGIICPGENITLSVTNDLEATSYTWSLPAGWIGSSTSNSIAVSGIESGENGTVSVYSSNECSPGTSSSLSVSVNDPVPSMPGAITGANLVCPGIDATYSISAVPYADTYEWILDGKLINENTGTNFLFNSTAVGPHTLEVLAKNECGSSTVSSMIIEVDDGAPGAVKISNSNGESSFCEGATGLIFSVPADAKADNYSWTVPAGWIITSSNENSVTVTAGSFGQDGNISVTASSAQACGEVSDSFPVSVKHPVPPAPADISGPAKVCMGSTNTFTVGSVNYATGYKWILSNGTSLTTSGPSVELPITLSGALDLTVMAINECGESSASSSFAIESFNSVPLKPGPIRSSLSSLNVCPPINGVTFTIDKTDHATDYTWNLPGGWYIVDGKGTESITVDISANVALSSGSVSVKANNTCGSSVASDPFVITLGKYVVADLGPDLTVCEVSAPISFTANVSFSNKSIKVVDIYSPDASGALPNPPNGPVKNFTFSYTPVAADFAKEYISIRLKTEDPKGECDSPIEEYNDEVIIYFRDKPNASFTSANSEVCYNTGTTLEISGTPNTTISYSNGASSFTANLDSSGKASVTTGNLLQTTTFTLMSIAYTNGAGCSENITGSTTISVNPIPNAVLTYNQDSFCNSDTQVYTPQFSNTAGVFEGGLFSATGIAVNATNGSFSPNGVPPGNYIITYAFDDPLSCGYPPVTTEITIFESVAITSQPQETRICEGEAVNLSVEASGDGLTYQWFKGSGSGTAISGANSATYSIPSSTEADEAYYYVEVSGASPCSTVKSNEVQLIIDQKMEILALVSDAANNEICEGGAVTFSVTTTSDDENLVYQWFDNSGNPIPGANQSTYSLAGVTPGDAGNYSVEIGGATGYSCSKLTSNNIALVVNKTPNADISYSGPYCTSDSGVKNVIFGNTSGNYSEGTFSYSANTAANILNLDPVTGAINPAASDPGIYTVIYTISEAGGCASSEETTQVTITAAPTASLAFAGGQTEFCNDSSQTALTPQLTGTGNYTGGTFSGIPGIDPENGTFDPAGLTAGTYTLTYNIPATSGCPALEVYLPVTIHEKIVITSEPFPVAVCSANNTQLEVAASGASLTYQWYKDGNPVNGANAAIYEIKTASVNEDHGNYYVMVSGAAHCDAVSSETVTVTVDENIVVTTQPQPQEVCAGAEINLSVSATASGGAPGYQWRKDGVALEGANSASLVIPNAQASDAGQYDVLITGADGYACEEGFSEIASVTVNAAPVVDAGSAIEACSTNTAIAVGNDAVASNYALLEWSTTGTGTFDNVNAMTPNYLPGTGETGEITLTLTAMGNGGCTSAFDEVLITINELPVINSFGYAQTEFCVSVNTAQAPVLNISNATISEGLFSYSGDTGNVLDLNLTSGEIYPSGSTPGRYFVTFEIPENGICTAVSETVELIIGDLPAADFSYTQPAVCRDTRAANPSLKINETGLLYTDADFFSNTTGLVFKDASTGEIDVDASASGAHMVTRTVDYSGTMEDGCAAVTSTFEISIDDKPVPDFSYNSNQYCSNDPNPLVQFPTGAVAGTFSEKNNNGGLIFANPATGEIDLAASQPGSYVVVNTVDNPNDACNPVSAEFAVTIQKLPDAGFSYPAFAFCQSSGTTPAPVISGDQGGTFTGSAGLVIDSAGVIDLAASTANLPNDPASVHTVTYTIMASGACPEVSSSVELRIDVQPEGGELSFVKGTEVFGRLFSTCEISERNTGLIADLVLSNYEGQIMAWQYKTFSGSSETVLNSDGTNFTGTTLPGATIESLGLTETTVFEVQISSGACTATSPVVSKTAILSVISSEIEPTPVTADKAVICIDDPVVLTAGSGYESGTEIGEGGNFDNSSITNHGWTIINSNGSEGDFNSSADNGRANNWLRTNPVDLWTANINSPNDLSLVRYDSGIGNDGNKGIAVVSGAFTGSQLITPVFSITAMDEAVLRFDQAYNLTEAAAIIVEITRNGGNTWEQLYVKTGPAKSGHTNDFGGGDKNSRPENKIEIDLGDYMGLSNLQIRFNYRGLREGDVWAVDGISIPNGPANVGMVWQDHTGEVPEIIGTNYTETWFPKQIGWNVSDITTTLEYSNGSCETAVHSEEIRVFVYDKWTTAVTADYGSCGNMQVRLTATATGAISGESQSYPTPDGYVGKWNISGNGNFSIANIEPADTSDPMFNPNIIFSAHDFNSFNVSWELLPGEKDPDGNIIENQICPPAPQPLEVIFKPCTALDFDGENDLIVIEDAYAGVNSIEAWIRPELAGGTIISGPNFRVTTPANVTPNSRWYHLAVSNGKLYIDGIEKSDLSLGSGSGSQTLIGAELINGKPANHFSGWIEELRLWNKALSVDQIRFLMNQRLIENGAQMGEQIPMDVPGGLDYSDLAGYYRLISAAPEPLANSPVAYLEEDKPTNGFTPDRAVTPSPGRLVNMETNQENTAPLPYFSGSDGVWENQATWLRPNVWELPNSGAVDWNIVRTSHSITSGNRNISLLGLISEANILDMEGVNPPGWTSGGSGNRLFISHYLLLNGIIDLNGESQLIQPNGSVVDQTSGIDRQLTGYLDRDQQGTASSYNYNYWSSPVSPGSLNADYSVGAVMMDGTTPTPVNINFGNTYHHADAGFTSPRKISAYWLHKFHGTANNYFRWEHIGSTGTLQVGEGYSMKGTSGAAAILGSQNYTFRGLPNNGTILMEAMNATGTGENYLLGNPYPSAIDTREFIRDNMRDVPNGRNASNIFNGTIYFWSHFANKTHYLEEYIGGYATYNLSGGVIAVAIDDRINATEDKGGRIPQQFIPVGQGFFVNTGLDPKIAEASNITIHGGQVTFKNSQRFFITENDINKSVFHSQEKKDIFGKEEATLSTEEQERIWLQFKSPKGYHRQILATADPNASDNFDLGYDAPLIENNAEDMYWYFNNSEFVIQGVRDFDRERELQLGLKIKEKGSVKISIDELHNIADDKAILLKDSLEGIVHNLREEPYITDVDEGVFTERFKLVFKDNTPITAPEDPVTVVEDGLFEVLYVNGTRKIVIKNPELIRVNRIYLNNLSGQQVHIYYNIPLTTKEELPVERFSSGVYVLKLHTANGIVTKKVVLE